MVGPRSCSRLCLIPHILLSFLLLSSRSVPADISAAEYNAAIDACGFAGQEDKVLELLVEMRDTGVGIDDDSFYCVRQAVDSDELWEQALELLREMLPKDRGFTY